MRLTDLFKQKKFVMSAEVFPPKKNGMLEGVIRALKDIKKISPDFVSITYGANGSGGTSTSDVASIAIDAFELNTVAHLTAVNMTKDFLDEQISILKRKEVENILVLRGDIVEESKFYDFHHATDLAEYIKSNYPNFNLVGACYPEGHFESQSLEDDLVNIKRKVDCGVEHLITQLFFSNDTFYRFLDKSQKAGIDVPISAGIMPIITENQIKRIVKMCGVEVPSEFAKILANNSGEDLFNAGVDYAISQINDLINHGVNGVHLYTMNRGDVAEKVFNSLKDKREILNG